MAVWSAVGMRYSPRSKLHYTAVPTLLGAATASWPAGPPRSRPPEREGHAGGPAWSTPPPMSLVTCHPQQPVQSSQAASRSGPVAPRP
jgi:hypothetical protein